MGLFSRKPPTERESFRDAMARAKVKNDERKAKNDERRQASDAHIAQAKRQDELLKTATDPATDPATRETAAAELIELIGQAKASKLIGARSRLIRRGWVR